MILSYRIPDMTERMRAATLRAAQQLGAGRLVDAFRSDRGGRATAVGAYGGQEAGHAGDASEQQMIEKLERRGYRVTRTDRAA